MSQSVIGALRVNLGLDAAQFRRGAREAEGIASRLGRQMQVMGAAISAVGLGLAAAIRSQINAADDIAKAADRIGIPIEALSQLQHAANLSGVSLSELESSMQRMARAMVEDAAAFDAIGVAVRGADGQMRPIMDVLQDVADRIAAMPDGAERTALAMDLMGRSGAQMIPLLQGGSGAIRELMDEADRLGLTLTEEAARGAERFNDNLTRLTTAATGLARQIATALIPVLAAITDAVAAVSTQFARLTPAQQEFAAGAAAVTVALGPLLLAVGTLTRAMVGLRAASFAALGPWGVLAALVTTAAAAFVAFNTDTDETGDLIDDVADAQDALNAAMATFAQTGAPDARRQAYAYARQLEQQALAALSAAEAEITLMEAELARFQSAPMEQRGLMGDVEESVMAENLELSRREVEALRETVEGARLTAHGLSVEMVAVGRDGAPAVQAVVVETEELVETLERVSGAAGQAADVEIPEMTNALEDAAAAGSQLESSFESAFVNAITGTEGLRGALAGLARDLSRMAAQAAFRGMFGGMFGGGGALSGLAGLFTNFGGARAMGGPVMAGTSYLVGERGPELFTPGRSGAITPNAAMGGGTITLRVVTEEAPGFASRVAVVATDTAQQVVAEYDRTVLPERVQQVNADPMARYS